MRDSSLLSQVTLQRGNLILLALALVSCTAHTPDFDTEVVEQAAPSAPASKPVKMPPRLEIKGSSEGIAIDEFFALQQTDGALIYDVRVPYFYKIDHIPGAINWPYNEYDAQVQKRDIEIQKALNSGKKVVLYCFNILCPEARNVAKKLSRRDYDVLVFSSGIDSWREAGLPLETSSAGNPD